MTMDKLAEVLKFITENADVVGFTVSEYLPFDEQKLHKLLSDISLFTEQGHTVLNHQRHTSHGMR